MTGGLFDRTDPDETDRTLELAHEQDRVHDQVLDDRDRDLPLRPTIVNYQSRISRLCRQFHDDTAAMWHANMIDGFDGHAVLSAVEHLQKVAEGACARMRQRPPGRLYENDGVTER